ncbi:MAG: sigma-70 family RNA polymerase sigma factor [Saprospiraceae bacterium]|nr:sigma-70 family RNA polymerase sigma factor [Saprospiraceae bacterium]HRD80142.1 sigma-70 family RNA polymerase sigma factor [Saprospiraceae bacterium]HRK83758.1 sigma-70 family RNA polymerase sigma factor [Saprospiraceae bacterium]
MNTKIATALDNASMQRDLIEQCKAGNRTAQFELYKQYSKGMYNVCLRMVHDSMDAEDVLQNAFVDIFTKMDSFRYESTIGAWIKRIVVNHCINFLKKKKLQWEELDDRFVNLREDQGPETNDSRLGVEQINKAIMMLPDGYRVVFSLYLLEGYDHEEISEILQISEATSKSQFSRAKAKLRDILSNKREIN